MSRMIAGQVRVEDQGSLGLGRFVDFSIGRGIMESVIPDMKLNQNKNYQNDASLWGIKAGDKGEMKNPPAKVAGKSGKAKTTKKTKE